MHRTILVPLGGSSFAELALPMAIALSEAMGARVVLVRATGGPIPGDTSAAQARAEAEWEAERYLTRTVRQLACHGVPVETAMPYLPSCEGILNASQAYNADLIVMCTHARSGLEKQLYGSVAENVLRRSTVPVMLLRPEDASDRAPVLKGSHILVPLDGSTFGETALPHACALARALDATLVLLRVVPIPVYTTALVGGFSAIEQLADWKQAEAVQYLAEISRGLTEDGLRVQTHTCVGRPVDAIVEEGETCRSSVIVMTTHGFMGANDLNMRGIVRGILERSVRPLLLVPPQASDLEL